MRGKGGERREWDPDADANKAKEEEREYIDLRQEKQKDYKRGDPLTQRVQLYKN
jgi:hypothetical protein